MTELGACDTSHSPALKFPSSTYRWKGRHRLRPPQTTLRGTYDGNHAVELFSPISSLPWQEGRERFVDTAMSGSNGRKAHIYRPKGRPNILRLPRRVVNHKRS
jgi:hypothetical protein